jgi:hypothetical protein
MPREASLVGRVTPEIMVVGGLIPQHLLDKMRKITHGTPNGMHHRKKCSQLHQASTSNNTRECKVLMNQADGMRSQWNAIKGICKLCWSP